MRLRRLTAVAVTAVASLALTGTALAAGNGATVLKDSRCQTNMFGTVCSTEHSVFKITDAGASGNTSVMQNYRFESTFTGSLGPIAGCVATTTNNSSSHGLATEDESGQLRYSLTYGSSFDCNGSSIKCTTQIDYAEVDGVVRVDRTRTVCTDPL